MMFENQRVLKWKNMLKEFPQRFHSKLISRGWKGIPNSIRGWAWIYLIENMVKVKTEKDGQIHQ